MADGNLVMGERRRVVGMWAEVRPNFVDGWRSLVPLVAASFVGGVAEAGVLVLISFVANSLIGDSPTLELLGTEWSRAGAMWCAGVLVLVRVLSGVAVARLTGRAAADAMRTTRRRVLRGYLQASWAARSSGRIGALQEVLSLQSEMAAGVVVSFATMLNALLNVAVFVIAAAVLDPLAALGVAALAASFGLLLRPIGGRTRRSSTDYVNRTQEFASGVTELSMLSRELETFGVGAAVTGDYDDRIDDVARRFGRTRFLVILTPQLYQALSLGVVVGILGVVSATAEADALVTIGAIVLLLVRALAGGQQAVSSSQVLNERLGYLSNVWAAIDELEAATRPRGTTPVAHIGEIVFDDVTFEYRAGEPVLRGLDLTIHRGETIGIVGPSGAGKSTIVQLLLRLRHPAGGAVRCGDADLADVREEDWARLAAFVPQDPALFTGTIADNVAFWRGLGREQITAACRSAHVWDEIEAFPDGLDTMVGTLSGGLSGGQRQRLAIARALASGPELLVLDEPTSALDLVSEERIGATLTELKGRVTMVIVAHRLSTLSFCDRIVVVADGRVQACAPHAELVGNSPFYDEALRLSGIKS